MVPGIQPLACADCLSRLGVCCLCPGGAGTLSNKRGSTEEGVCVCVCVCGAGRWFLQRGPVGGGESRIRESKDSLRIHIIRNGDLSICPIPDLTITILVHAHHGIGALHAMLSWQAHKKAVDRLLKNAAQKVEAAILQITRKVAAGGSAPADE